MKEGDYATACGWLVKIDEMPLPNTEFNGDDIARVLLIATLDGAEVGGVFEAGKVISLYAWRLSPFAGESAELIDLVANLG